MVYLNSPLALVREVEDLLWASGLWLKERKNLKRTVKVGNELTMQLAPI